MKYWKVTITFAENSIRSQYVVVLDLDRLSDCISSSCKNCSVDTSESFSLLLTDSWSSSCSTLSCSRVFSCSNIAANPPGPPASLNDMRLGDAAAPADILFLVMELTEFERDLRERGEGMGEEL